MIRGWRHYDDRGSRDYDRGYDPGIGSGRGAVGSVGTVGMMMTEEVRTTAKTGMTDTMINHGAPEMITLGTIIGVMIEAPSPKDPN